MIHAVAFGGSNAIGESQSLCDLYNSTTSLLKTLPEGRALTPAVSFFSSAFQSYITVVAGGDAGTGNARDGVMLVHHNSESIVNTAQQLSSPRYYLCAAVTEDEQYVMFIGGYVGGSSNFNGSPTVDVYDTIAVNDVRTLNLTVDHIRCAAASLGPYVYVAGGQGAPSSSLYSLWLSFRSFSHFHCLFLS